MNIQKHPVMTSENLEALTASSIFIETWNKQNHSDYGNPTLGNNPPDTVSTNSQGTELWMEITEFNELQRADIGKKDFTAREVNPIKTLITTLIRKGGKYEPAFRSKLFLLLKGDVVGDSEFEEYENQGHFDLSFNKKALNNLGFKGIWYISPPPKKKAFKIF